MHTTEAQSVLYGGADLHGNNVFLSVCDQTGEQIFSRRVKPTLEAVNGALDAYWPRMKSLAVESTFNWYWFVDGLRAEGRDVRLCNPAKSDQYDGLKITGDPSDARWLAEMLRLGILPECYVYPKEQRDVRDALRRRMLLVRQRTQSMLSMEGVLAREGLPVPSASKLKTWTDKEVDSVGLTPFKRLQVHCMLEAMRAQNTLVQEIEKAVLAQIEPSPDFERVQQVPGIGSILGMTVLLETGEFSRFATAGHYASYCRTVKSERTSNGKTKGHNNARNGNAYLAWAFVEAASRAPRFNPRIRTWFDRKRRRRNGCVAVKALACKLAKAVWHVMHGRDFDEVMLFG